MAAKGRVLTAARARLTVQGQPVGYVQGVSLEENLEYAEIEALDNIEVEEHVPVRYRVRGSCRLVRLVGETAKTRGHFARVGANPGEHLKNILTLGNLVMNIEDNQTSLLTDTVIGVKFTSNVRNIDAGSFAGHNMDWVALRIRDESETG